jgi:hypothetical protein
MGSDSDKYIISESAGKKIKLPRRMGVWWDAILDKMFLEGILNENWAECERREGAT